MSKKTESSYHHGNLRETLIDKGVEMLLEGKSEISMRQIAKRAGVSHNAPYQHFSDKEAVLAAIAERGFERLGDRMQKVFAATPDVAIQERMVEMTLCYVEFATEYPAYFKVMFGHLAHSDYPDLLATSQDAFSHLITMVEESQASGDIIDGNAYTLAINIWFMAHGISAIIIADKIPPVVGEDFSIRSLVEQSVNTLCLGMLAD